MRCAVLFDWDGTLADSLALVATATNEVLTAHGFSPVSLSTVHSGMRFPTAARFAFHIDKDMADRGVHEFMNLLSEEFYEAALRLGDHVLLFPGVRTMLLELSRLGYPMAVVTNNRRRTVEALVSAADLTSILPVVIGEEDVERPKPDPSGILDALARLSAYEDALFVGDSSSDAGAAKAAGIASVGVAWPADSTAHHTPEEFDIIAGTPEEVVQIVAERGAVPR